MKFFFRVFLALVIAALGLPSLGFSAPITYTAHLNGPSESPPNGSPGTGFTTVYHRHRGHTLQVNVTFSGLTADQRPRRISMPLRPHRLPVPLEWRLYQLSPAFLGVTSGTYDTIPVRPDPTLTWNPAFITDFKAELRQARKRLWPRRWRLGGLI